jgi:hypothetical protein
MEVESDDRISILQNQEETQKLSDHHGTTKQEGSYLKARKKALTRNPLTGTMILDSPTTSSTLKNNYLLFMLQRL